jgi:hypothetical protein
LKRRSWPSLALRRASRASFNRQREGAAPKGEGRRRAEPGKEDREGSRIEGDGRVGGRSGEEREEIQHRKETKGERSDEERREGEEGEERGAESRRRGALRSRDEELIRCRAPRPTTDITRIGGRLRWPRTERRHHTWPTSTGTSWDCVCRSEVGRGVWTTADV